MKKIFTFLFVLSIFSNSFSQNNSLSPGTWMSSLKGDIKLCKLTIPGTHDTGATSGAFGAKCQTASISEQLESGIRFLDIRLEPKSDKLGICHGIVSMGTFFEEDVLIPCKQFLNDNPDETIIMSIKHENGDQSQYLSLLEAVLTDTENQIYLLKSLTPTTTLDQARGKIVCLHRNTPGWDYYGGAFNGFSDNTTFSNNINSRYGTPTSFSAQDYYSISSGLFASIDYSGKLSAITSLLTNAKNNSSDKWFFNFLSATALTSAAGPETIAKKIGPQVASWLSESGTGFYGVVIMDFANSTNTSGPALTDFLINCNINYSSQIINEIQDKEDDCMEVIVENNYIKIKGTDIIPEIYNLLGKRVYGQLSSGIYIVKTENRTYKIKI